MTATDTRPPLYLTRTEAVSWMSLHSEDRGRQIIIREWRPAESTVWPPRKALGWNAKHEWVWIDDDGNPIGEWP